MGEFITLAAAKRELTIADLNTVVESQGLLLPQEALEAKLVDMVTYDDAVLTQLHELTAQDADESSFRQISLSDYARELVPDALETPQSKQRVAIVYAEGNIVSGEGDIGQIGGERFAQILREIRLDEEIKAVVLRVNSPGGSASASEKIAREIELIQAKQACHCFHGQSCGLGRIFDCNPRPNYFCFP